MERELSEPAVAGADPVTETLERLDVADRLEDLRRHIDGLIERLSGPGAAEAQPARPELPAALEGQIEALGSKVESASCLLAELADVLEAQTERIETIEQQLGEPDLGAAAGTPRSEVPRFSMRPAQSPEQVPLVEGETVSALLIQMRGYLEQRFERLEKAIALLDQRLAGLRAEAENRDREVRDLEERLLILVDSPPRDRDEDRNVEVEPSRPTASRSVSSHAAVVSSPTITVAPPVTARATPPSAPPAAGQATPWPAQLPLSPPAHMPVLVQAMAHAERRLRRSKRKPQPAGVDLVRNDADAVARIAVGRPPRSPVPARTEAIASTTGPTAAVPHESIVEPEAGEHVIAKREPAPVSRNGVGRELDAGVIAASQPTHLAAGAQAALERLVEREVKAVREFRPGARQPERASKAHPTVLVVDDAPDALKLLSLYLSRTGYNVVTAISAEDCLAKLRHHAIDAVVLDAKLQGASGEHVCRVLRTDDAFAHRRHVPVIIYTAYPEEFPFEVCARWQADEYVEKGGDLLPLVRALVRLTSQDNRVSIS